MVSRREKAAWAALLLLALGLRLWGLADRPFHHDESVHGWFTHQLVHSGEYVYDPVYHGPVQYYAVAVSFLLLGESDFTARLPAALGGTALVALALLLRPRFGRRAAFASGALLALSPSLLYYTRFCREDVWSLLGTAGALLFLDVWVRRERLGDLVVATLFAACAFGAKENFYVLLALMVPSVAAVTLEPGRGLDLRRRADELLAFLSRHAVALAGAFLLFFVVSELLYTFFLVHPASGNPAWTAISYWWGQHKVERIGGPKWFHLPRLLQYEFAILLPAFAVIARWRRLSAVERFLAGWGLSSIAMYAWLGEKTPWLIVHQILPFVPLAGRGWAGVSRRRWAWPPGLAAAAASVVTALSLSFWHPVLTPADPRAESLVYVQTAPELLAVEREIESVARAGVSPAAAVDGEAAWPLSWYLRDVPVRWGKPTATEKPPIVIVDPASADEVAAVLGPAYTRAEVPLRVWWLPEVSADPLHPTPRELLRYLLTRVPWSPIGWQPVTVFRETGENRGTP